MAFLHFRREADPFFALPQPPKIRPINQSDQID